MVGVLKDTREKKEADRAPLLMMGRDYNIGKRKEKKRKGNQKKNPRDNNQDSHSKDGQMPKPKQHSHPRFTILTGLKKSKRKRGVVT